MEFKIRDRYSKDMFICISNKDILLRIILIGMRILVIIGLTLNIFLVTILSVPEKRDIINFIVFIIGALLSVYLPSIGANLNMLIIKARKMDGERILIFNNETLLARNSKYNRERSFPVSKITKIKKMGGYFKIFIGGKILKGGRVMYIDTNGFEKGNAEDFYNWIVSITNKEVD